MDCNRITDAGVAEVARRTTGLAHLSLSGCSRVTDDALKVLTSDPITGHPRGEALRTLNLSFCQDLTGDGLEGVCRQCGSLEALELSGCAQVDDETLRQVVQCCSALQTVKLSHCRLLTDKAVEYMAEFLWVEELDISYVPQLTDRSPEIIADNFTGMVKMNCSWCRKLTNAGLRNIGNACKCLRELIVVACDNFAKDGGAVLKDMEDNNGSLVIIRERPKAEA